jgi:hypothetical protein
MGRSTTVDDQTEIGQVLPLAIAAEISRERLFAPSPCVIAQMQT